MPDIAKRWACECRRCPNHGYTCWIDTTGLGKDNPKNHYQVTAHFMMKWNDENKTGIYNTNMPSPGLIARLSAFKATLKATTLKVSTAVPAASEAGDMSSVKDLLSTVVVGLHRLPFVTRCDRGCLMFTSIY